MLFCLRDEIMKKQFFLVLFVFLIFDANCASTNQSQLVNNTLSKEQITSDNNSEQNPSSCSAGQKNILNNKNLVFLGKWRANPKSNDDFTYLAQRFENSPDYEGRGVKFCILDAQGNEIYKQNFGNINAIYQKTALRDGSQLFLEVDYDGISSLRVLAFDNDKIVDLIEDSQTGEEILLGGGVAIIPQYINNTNNLRKPFQILAISKDGTTQIFRYKDGKYRFYGSFSQKEVDNFIEKISDKE